MGTIDKEVQAEEKHLQPNVMIEKDHKDIVNREMETELHEHRQWGSKVTADKEMITKEHTQPNKVTVDKDTVTHTEEEHLEAKDKTDKKEQTKDLNGIQAKVILNKELQTEEHLQPKEMQTTHTHTHTHTGLDQCMEKRLIQW